MNEVEVRVLLGDGHKPAHLEFVSSIDQEIQRQAHRDVGLQRRVHGDQDTLHGVVEVGLGRDHPIENGLAILGFPDLQVRRLGLGLDVIACCIDLKESAGLATNLPAQNKAAVELNAELRECGMVTRVDLSHGRTHTGGRLGHGGCRPERFRLGRTLKDVSHTLGDGQVARTHEHQDPVTRPLIDGHFAEGGDLVHARIGAGIREEHQALLKIGGNAVGHG